VSIIEDPEVTERRRERSKSNVDKFSYINQNLRNKYGVQSFNKTNTISDQPHTQQQSRNKTALKDYNNMQANGRMDDEPNDIDQNETIDKLSKLLI